MFYHASQNLRHSPQEVWVSWQDQSRFWLSCRQAGSWGTAGSKTRGIFTFLVHRQPLYLSAACWRPLNWHGSVKGCVCGWCRASNFGFGPAGKLPMSGICRNTNLVEKRQDPVLKVTVVYFLYFEHAFDISLNNNVPFSLKLSLIKKAFTDIQTKRAKK